MANKNYVVVARFDVQTNRKLKALRNSLNEAGHLKAISKWPPHITIAAYEDVDSNALLEWAGKYAERHASFEIMLSSLGVLPPGIDHADTAVLFTSPSPSKRLIDFYYGFHEKLDEYCGNLGYMYSAKCAHPYAIHSTIGIFEVSKLQRAMEHIFAQQIFGMAKITALEVYTYPMALIQRFNLGEDECTDE